MTIDDLGTMLGDLAAKVGDIQQRVEKLEAQTPRSKLASAWAWVKANKAKAISYAGNAILLACLLAGGVTLPTIPGCDPTPGPKPPPPPPPPPPDPAPIPIAGLRVLIVYETGEKKNWGIPKTVADYLNAKCVKVGNQPEWRVFDKDVVLSGESKIWQDAIARKRDSLPWVLISDGKTGFEGPWPFEHVEDQLALLRKYGG